MTERILFITATRIGDAVLTSGVLEWLRRTHPDARFTIVCGPEAAPVFAYFPALEALHVLSKRRWKLHWVALWAKVVGKRWKLVVDMRDSAIPRLVWAGERRIYRRRNACGHKVEQYAALFGLNPPLSPVLWLNDDLRAQAAAICPPGPRYIALAPAANWTKKEWPIKRFAELAARLAAPNVRFILLATESQRETVVPLARAVECIDGTGKWGLMLAAAVIERCALFIGNDSGLMHIAAASGTPTLGLFGPTNESLYAPWGAKTALVKSEVAWNVLQDIDEAQPMTRLSVDEVEKAARLLLTPSPLEGEG